MATDEEQIRAIVAEWLRATVAGDADAQRPLMSEDIVFLQAGRPPMQGREAFLQAFRQSVGLVKMEPHSEIQEIRVSGNLAWCWNKLKVKVTPLPDGAPMHLTGNAVSLFEKQNGRWVLTRDANLMAPDQPRG